MSYQGSSPSKTEGPLRGGLPAHRHGLKIFVFRLRNENKIFTGYQITKKYNFLNCSLMGPKVTKFRNVINRVEHKFALKYK